MYWIEMGRSLVSIYSLERNTGLSRNYFVSMSSILREPLTPDLNVKPALLVLQESSASDRALDVFDSIIKSSLESWIKSVFAADPSGAEVFAVASPFFASNSWLAALVTREWQLAVDAALLAAVDLFAKQPDLVAFNVAQAARNLQSSRLSDDRKAGMDMCRLRRAGLLVGDVLNAQARKSRY